MAELTSWCRGCPSRCGVLVTTAEGRLERTVGDPGHPLTAGFDCDFGRNAPHQANRPDRVLEVLRSDGTGALQPSSWELALDDIGAAVQAEVRSGGWGSVGLLVGGTAQRSQRLWRSVATIRERLGPFPVFTQRARTTAPLEHASRLVVGRPVSLRTDLARAHHLLLIGGNQLDEGWSEGHAGQAVLRRLGSSQRRRLRLSVADPRRSGLAQRAHDHLRLRPGSELYLLLGMASAMIRSGWYDRRQVELRTRGIERLERALEPWPPTRCAELCGLEVADITAEAMRFSRAPSAAILPAPQALGTPWCTLTAWAILVVHALTSNLLEPGGLYAHPGAFVPASTVPERNDLGLVRALSGGLRVLICVESDPVGSGLVPQLPSSLERLVCIDRFAHLTARASHWLLPATHPFEEPDLGWADRCDRHWLQGTAALVVQPGDCRPRWKIVEGLLAAGDPAAPGRARGLDHSRAERAELDAAAQVVGLDAQRLLEAVGPGLTRTAEQPRGRDLGAVDRATWAVHHAHGQLELAPEPLVRALEAHDPWSGSPTWPLRLLGNARRDPARGPWERPTGGTWGVGLHPDLGYSEGEAVRVVTAHGCVTTTVQLDPDLRPDAADLPEGAARLVDTTHLDRWADAPWTDGQPCRVEPVRPSSSGSAPKPRA